MNLHWVFKKTGNTPCLWLTDAAGMARRCTYLHTHAFTNTPVYTKRGREWERERMFRDPGGCLIVFSLMNAHSRRKKGCLALLCYPQCVWGGKAKHSLVSLFFCINLSHTFSHKHVLNFFSSLSTPFSCCLSPPFLKRRDESKGAGVSFLFSCCSCRLWQVEAVRLPGMCGDVIKSHRKRCGPKSLMNSLEQQCTFFKIVSVISCGALSCSGLRTGWGEGITLESFPSSMKYCLLDPIADESHSLCVPTHALIFLLSCTHDNLFIHISRKVVHFVAVLSDTFPTNTFFFSCQLLLPFPLFPSFIFSITRSFSPDLYVLTLY